MSITLSEEMTKYRSIINESWGTKMHTPDSKKGMWDGWSLTELNAELKKLKDNPKKTESLKTREKEVEFAIRAKQKNKWGKIKETADNEEGCTHKWKHDSKNDSDKGKAYECACGARKMVKEETELTEKWGKETKTPASKKGMFKGRTKESLRAELARLKKNPDKTEALKKKEKEINFALRAKNSWGKASESYVPGPFSKSGSIAKLAEAKSETTDCDECGVEIDHGTLCADCKKKSNKEKSPKFKNKE